MSKRVTVVAVAVLIAAIGVTAALATPAIGTIATLFARGTLTKPVNADADGIKLRADHATDHAVQTITFPPGSSSGWHRHPGVVLVTVQSGTLAHYNSSCTRETITAGQSFWESGPRASVVRNESAHDNVVVYVSYIVPAGVALRIDMPNPGCTVE